MIALARLSLRCPVLALRTVAATFGVLALLFTGALPLLGGPGYIDAMSIIAIFTAVFGLSTAYEVFLLPVPTAADPGAEPPSRPAAPPRVKPIPVQP
jgi:hypothetical protein